MTKVRRALVLSSTGRYASLTVNFFLVAILSRVLSPAEIGVSVIGTTMIGLIEMLRDVATPYIIQRVELDTEDVPTVFTCMLLVTLFLAGGLVIGAGAISRWYSNPGIAPYCELLAVSLLPGPVERPIIALLQRDMAFERMTVIMVGGTLANATVAVGAALAGFSFMSFAYAALAGNLAVALLAVGMRRDRRVFRFTLAKWRPIMSKATYSASWALASRTADVAATLLLGRWHQIDTVGMYNRARVTNDLPNKLLLSGLAPVIFPALAAEARSGRKMGEPYLLALGMVTALNWSGFLILAILAHPIVEILLGPPWLPAVPLVQIMALANIIGFAKSLTQPALMAMGAFRDLLLSAVVVLPAALVLTISGAILGAHALAWSLVAVAAFDACVELSFVRRCAHFDWIELFMAIRKSFVIALCSAVGPAVVMGIVPVSQTPVHVLLDAAPLAAGGWIVGLFLTNHPLSHELRPAMTAHLLNWHGWEGIKGLLRVIASRHANGAQD